MSDTPNAELRCTCGVMGCDLAHAHPGPHAWQDEYRDQLRDEVARLRDEVAEYEQLTGRLAYLLTATANALKGPPPDHGMHDWSDLPYVARKHDVRAELGTAAQGDGDEGLTCPSGCPLHPCPHCCPQSTCPDGRQR